MRPVNLIPPEQRRGDRAPLRSGPLAYVIVGGLAAALLAITGLVMTQNAITDRENEVAELEVQRDAAAQRAEALAPYAEFAALQESREQTITSLAQSRFDWERVMRELAIVIPSDVSLSSLEATVGADEAESAGPELAMNGCAASQPAVAQLLAALEDIDGVTTVSLESSARAGSGDGESQEGGGECSSKPDLAAFSLTAAFEAVAVAPQEPASSQAAAAVPAESGAPDEQAASVVPGVAE